MKFKEYAHKINKLLKDKPETAEYEAVCASDDEGNNFGPVNFDPTVGRFEDDGFQDTTSTPNAVCIN
jgi:hypothetical protein